MSFKILFVNPNFRAETLVSSGVSLLSRILKNHDFEVDLFDTTDYGLNKANDYDRLLEESLGVRPSPHRSLKYIQRDPWVDLNEKINLFCPNLIAMSCTESTFLLGIKIIQHIDCRDPRSMPVILGGSFATYAPARALDFPEIDIVCVGEGEKPLLELCQKMQKGKSCRDIAGLAYRDKLGNVCQNPLPPPVDLDDNPTNFDIGIYDSDRLIRPMAGKLYRMAAVETARGCPYSCAFCNSRNTKVRKKSMSKVREELLYYRDHHHIEYAFFWADTFLMMSKEEIEEFCDMYKEINLPFWVQTRVETVTDWSLKKLKDVGLHRIDIGIENGDEKFRRKVIHKTFSNKQAVKATRIFAKLGITYNTNNIVGYPGETREIAMNTVELNRLFEKVDTTSCYTFTPYHGTLAREEAVKAGFMDPDAIAPGVIMSGNAKDAIFKMPQFPPEEVEGLRRNFALYVRFPKSRWSEIRRAEKRTKEGIELFKKLQKEYRQRFFK